VRQPADEMTRIDPVVPIRLLDEPAVAEASDPGELMLTCANCGARMDERKCKLICRCGYFLSCSDYV
jgi:hypothetical protein